MRFSSRRGAVAVAAATGLLIPSVAGTVQADDHRDGPIARLVQAVTLDNTLGHLRHFQQIADVNGGTRAAGSTGHAASAGYVAGQLEAAGYDVEYQPFEFLYFDDPEPVLERVEPEATAYVIGDDFATMQYSGAGDVTAAVVPVDLVLPPGAEPNTSTSGCEPEDFDGFPAGSIALLQRGTCPFFDKATNAEAAGAAAVVIFNEGQPATNAQPEDRTVTINGDLGAPVGIPVVGTSFAVGEALAAEGTVVHVATDPTTETRTTYNVIAETPGGRDDNVVMVGSHLDSVPAGPGINDNGSGTGAQLEVALRFAEEIKSPRNKVRFAWWSAEEFGLLGAEHYVANLPDAELGDIALYLNFDMVGSPNFARFLYDGDDSDGEGAGPGPDGSDTIEDVFERFFDRRNLPTEGTDFDGRSDYGPFILAGIPAGGLFTGAEGIKTEEQAQLYGGTAGEPYDPCYHEACDTTQNIDNEALEQNADAIAFVVGYFSFNTKDINDRARVAAKIATLTTAAVTAHSNHAVR